MATIVRLRSLAPAINMDYVVDIDWANEEEGKLALTMHDGSAKVLSGADAQRILTWIASRGELPALTFPDPNF